MVASSIGESCQVRAIGAEAGAAETGAEAEIATTEAAGWRCVHGGRSRAYRGYSHPNPPG